MDFEDRATEQPGSSLSLIDRQQIDIQVATARNYKRDVAACKKELLSLAGLDEETAMECFYTLKRKEKGGKTKYINGPSVRLAEMAFSAYGNLRVKSVIIDDDGSFVTAEGMAWDVQNNVAISMEVRRRVTTSEGRRYSDDMVVITENAAVAIAFRNVVFKIIPSSIINPAYSRAREIAIGTQTTLSSKREKLFKRFEALGVNQERVLKALEKSSLDNVNLEDIEVLIGFGTALKDSSATIEELFGPGETTGGTKESQEEAAKRREEELRAAKAKKAPQAETPEPAGAAGPEKPNVEEEIPVWQKDLLTAREQIGDAGYRRIIGVLGFESHEQIQAKDHQAVLSELLKHLPPRAAQTQKGAEPEAPGLHKPQASFDLGEFGK
jgi:hypothetical protein